MQDEVKGKKGLIFSSQDKIVFSMVAKAELTGEEEELLKKYKIRGQALFVEPVKNPNQKPRVVRINTLTEGEHFVGDVAELLSYEEEIKGACRNLKIYLDVLRKFGGEEVIEY
jgi:hypothetical protein